MPELPEVETVRRRIQPMLQGRTFAAGPILAWPRTVRSPSPEELQALLPGHRILSVQRRAKYLLLLLTQPVSPGPALEGATPTLVVHFGMTGHLDVRPASTPRGRFDHTVFPLDEGLELRFRDPRKLGKLWLVEDPGRVTGKLGPEPLDEGFTPEVLATVLEHRRTALKALLMDQKAIAGIGNIYADEALFHARLHPLRPAASLSASEVERLHHAIRHVLEAAIQREMGTYDGPNERLMVLSIRRFGPSTCPRCGTLIQRVIIQSRSTYFCPACQPA